MSYRQLRELTRNFGPQHPAAHGVLRLVVVRAGEVVTRAEPHIGLLHRGTEKLMEYKRYGQGLPYMDRLDYVSMIASEHTYCIAVEELEGRRVPSRAKYIRVRFLERTRRLNHRLAVCCHALDVGAMTPYFWGFEEREKLIGFYERVSGARRHAAYIRAGGVSGDRGKGLLEDRQSFTEGYGQRLDELDALLTRNRIWQERLVDVGVVTAKEAISWGFSGVMLRSTGLHWDLRKDIPYEVYEERNIEVPVGTNGDCYDRYRIRIGEIRASRSRMKQVLGKIPEGRVIRPDYKSVRPSRETFKSGIEPRIAQFQLGTVGVNVPKGEVYIGTEAPKGEFGVYRMSDGSGTPYRVKRKAPGFAHLSSLDAIASGHRVSDLVTIIGTQDIVFGEVDR